MALGGTYNTGTASVTNASTSVPGVGVLWADVIEGDELWVGTAIGVIDSVNGTFDTITLKDGWAGSTVASAPYRILKRSWLRYDPSLTQERLRTFIMNIEAAGLFLFVDGAAPDPSFGEDGQYAIKMNDPTLPWTVWAKQSGVWTSYGSPAGMNYRKIWSGATAYLLGDSVTRSGSAYISILGGTNHPPESSPTYWGLLATGGGRYDLGAWSSDRPASAEQLLSFIVPTTVMFNTNLSDSRGRAQTAATVNSVFSLQKNGAQFGTVTFAGTFPNLLSYSHSLVNSIWARGSIDPTITMLGSDAINSLNKLVANASNVRHTVAQAVTVTAQQYTLSAEIFDAEYHLVGLSFGGGANIDGAYFSAADGSVGTTAAATTTAVTSLGSGHYRVSITRTLAAGTAQAQLEPHSADNQAAFAGNGTSGVYAGFVQFEAGAGSTYVATVVSGSVGTFAAATDTTFTAGDVFGVVSPNPRDATLAGISLTVTGFR